jgi:transposase
MATTPTTLLRQVMTLPIDPCPAVRVLGIDDFAWKKGRRYGTVLVDLEARKIIDVLPDRSCATVAKWMSAHPEIEIVSRDRGTDYAAAAREAAPQAKQIADRFHLVRNLADVLQPLLSRCRTAHRQERNPLPASEAERSSQPRVLPHPETWRPHSPQQVERRYQANQAERETRYQQIMQLRSQGLIMEEIGKQMGMTERTVRRWLKEGGPPVHRRRTKRFSLFDPYAAFVLEQWQAGVYDGVQIYEAIRQQGFRGSQRMVQRFLQTLRKKRRPLSDLAPPDPLEQCASRQMVWLFIRKEKDLTEEEKATVASLRQASPLVNQIVDLVQDFLVLVRERQGERLDQWMETVETSAIPELQRFAQGLLRDKEAVVAGLTLAYSNGPVEAQVHKLKLVKRQAFGRAKLPLLRRRLLLAV